MKEEEIEKIDLKEEVEEVIEVIEEAAEVTEEVAEMVEEIEEREREMVKRWATWTRFTGEGDTKGGSRTRGWCLEGEHHQHLSTHPPMSLHLTFESIPTCQKVKFRRHQQRAQPI